MTSSLLLAAVGANAENHRDDVITVQHLLNRSGLRPALAEDGIVGPRTLARIRDYQAHILHFPRPDGRVDPQGRTLTSLLHRLASRSGGQGGNTPGGATSPTGRRVDQAAAPRGQLRSARPVGSRRWRSPALPGAS